MSVRQIWCSYRCECETFACDGHTSWQPDRVAALREAKRLGWAVRVDGWGGVLTYCPTCAEGREKAWLQNDQEPAEVAGA